ncbi:IclR family transcriptional regulator [Pseudarthrobacter sp. P1]|uniref:IclR family transcriptional regulator n=1 Tax=Pseudarthrobacter sp. P1 TaxID=3418418 RepID=UPI003CF6A9B9
MSANSSMGRGLEVLTAVSQRTRAGFGGGTVSDIAGDMGRDRSQVSRGLKTISAEEFLVKGPGSRTYRLHWQLYAEAQALTEQRLRTDGLTSLEKLVEETGEGCYLGVLSGDSTVTIGERVPPGNKVIGSWIGRPYPAYCSDAGQALLWDAPDDEVRAVFSRTSFTQHGPHTPLSVDDFLARLAAARERGYSIVDEEAEPGLYSIAAPVRDFRSEVVAALQIVGPKVRLEPRRAECAAALLRWAAWLEGALAAPSQPV